MPANLPPQFFEVEKKFREASSLEEKIEYLKEMLAIMPHHKGTDKLRAMLRAKMAKLQDQLEAQRRQKKGGFSYRFPREGAGRIGLCGMPNSGKSTLFNTLTGADVKVADYPFTTTEPYVGMTPFEEIKFQFLDMPPINADFPWMTDIYRSCDLILVLLDLGNDDVIEQPQVIKKELERRKLHNVKILYCGNKCDDPSSKDRLEVLKEFYPDLNLILISGKTGEGLSEMKKKIFEALEIIRVFTKAPGKPPDYTDPLILEKGATVIDAAEALHKDLARNFKYARIWGEGRLPGQKVDRFEELKDKDVIEIHAD